MTTQIQAVAFDLDGTLCDSIPDLAAAANAMRQTLGMATLPAATVQSYVGDGIGVLVHRALTDNPQGTASDAQWQQGYTAFIQHYAEHIADHTRAYPETEAGLGLLHRCASRLPLSPTTNPRREAAQSLEAGRLFQHHHRRRHPAPKKNPAPSRCATSPKCSA